MDELTSNSGFTDVQALLASRLHERMQETSEALACTQFPGLGNTPLIAFQRARRLAAAGSTTAAITTLNNLLQEQPTETYLRLELARTHALANDPQDVLQDLSGLQLAKLTGNSRSDYILLVTSATLRTNEIPRIIDLWLDLSPQFTFSELMAGGDVTMQHLTSVETRKVLADAIQDRLQQSAGNWRLSALLARISAAEGDHRSELQHYQQFLAVDQENVPMLRFVAELAMQSSALPLQLNSGSNSGLELHASSAEGTDLAVQLYRRLIQLQPRVTDHYSGLMRAYQVRGEVESAKRVALELADRGSSTSEACVAAGTILEESGLHPDALVFYRNAVKQDPENFVAWMHYAGALRKVGKLPEAEAIYKRILEEGLHGVPFNQPALVAALLAIAHDSGSVMGLVNYLDSLRQRDLPGKQEFYLTAAKLFMQVGQLSRAESCLEEFYSAFPDSKFQPEAQLLLGQLQYTRKDYRSARMTFQAITDKFTSTSAAITAAFNIGEILRQMGNTTEAVDVWEQLARRHAADDKALAALYEAGLAAYVEMRDSNRGISLLQQLLQSDTEDLALLQKARAALERMQSGKPILDYNAAS